MSRMLSVPTVFSHGNAVLIQKGAPEKAAANWLKAPDMSDTWQPSDPLLDKTTARTRAALEPSSFHTCLSAALSGLSEGAHEGRKPLSALQTNALATLLTGSDEYAALAFCQKSFAESMDRSELTDEVLAPAIRLLGQRWDQDRLCFSDMTVATARAQMISRSWQTEPVHGPVAQETQPALFATLSRQRHTLGIILAAHAFRDRGQWDVNLVLNASVSELVSQAKTLRARVVGFTVGERRDVQDVYRAIQALRTLPFRTQVIVGGNAASLLEERCNHFLLDAIVPDIASALAATND